MIARTLLRPAPPAQINATIDLLEYKPVHAQYAQVKGYACRDVGAQLLTAWTCITASGAGDRCAVLLTWCWALQPA